MYKTLNAVAIGAATLALAWVAEPALAASSAEQTPSGALPLALNRMRISRPVVITALPAPTRYGSPPSPPPVANIPPPGHTAAGDSPGMQALEQCRDQCEAALAAANQDDSIYMDYDLFVVVEGGIRLPEELVNP